MQSPIIKSESEIPVKIPKQTELMILSRSDLNLNKIKLLKDEVGVEDCDGHTALMYAIMNGAFEVVRYLHMYREERRSSNTTALIVCCQHQSKLFKHFLSQACILDINEKCVLMYAIDNNFFQAIGVLAKLERKTITCRNTTKETCLMHAAIKNNVDACMLLANQIGRMRTDGKTALMLAIENDSMEVIEYLLKHPLENKSKKMTSLMLAVKLKKVYFAKFMQFAGYQNAQKDCAMNQAIIANFQEAIDVLLPHEKDLRLEQNKSALMVAAQHNNLVTASQLLHQVGMCDSDGYTALMYAIKNRSFKCVDLLKTYEAENYSHKKTSLAVALLFGIDYQQFLQYSGRLTTDDKDKSYLTALQLSVMLNNSEAINDLFEIEKDITDYAKQTLLMFCAKKNKVSMAEQVLYQAGKVDVYGRTALYYAIAENNLEILELLQDYYKENITPFTTSLITAVMYRRDYFWMFLGCVGKSNLIGYTALQIAIKKSFTQAISVLSRFEEEKVSSDGTTALMMAAAMDNPELTVQFISQVGMVDAEEYTALFVAIENDSQCVIDILSQYEEENVTSTSTSLIQSAEFNRPYYWKFLKYIGRSDTDGTTALMCASVHGNAEIVKGLIEEAGIQDNSGCTALMLATYRYGDYGPWELDRRAAQLEIIQTLNRNEKERESKQGHTVLQVCIRCIILSAELIDLFADQIGKKDASGNTALVRFLQFDHFEFSTDEKLSIKQQSFISELIRSEVGITNESGETSLMFLISCKFNKFILDNFSISSFLNLAGCKTWQNQTALMTLASNISQCSYGSNEINSMTTYLDFLLVREGNITDNDGVLATQILLQTLASQHYQSRFNSILMKFLITEHQAVRKIPDELDLQFLQFYNLSVLRIVVRMMNINQVKCLVTLLKQHWKMNFYKTLKQLNLETNKKYFDLIRNSKNILQFESEFKSNLTLEIAKNKIFADQFNNNDVFGRLLVKKQFKSYKKWKEIRSEEWGSMDDEQFLQ